SGPHRSSSTSASPVPFHSVEIPSIVSLCRRIEELLKRCADSSCERPNPAKRMGTRIAESRRSLRRVALIMNSQVAPRRRMLAGVARYMHEHEPWAIYLKPFGVEMSLSDWARDWNGDGIMAGVWDVRPEDIRGVTIPMVD